MSGGGKGGGDSPNITGMIKYSGFTFLIRQLPDVS